MKVFVSGGAGFIGSNFIRYILGKHKDVRILNYDKLTYSGNLDNLKDVASDKRYKFIRGDISNKKQLEMTFKKFQPDYVINLAAETHVDKSIHEDASQFINSNVVGVFNFLNIIKINPQVQSYVQVSTDEVYGSLELGSSYKFQEGSPLLPNSPYAASKASGDLLCRSFYRTFGVPVIIARPSNNYGPNQYPEKIIPFFILRLLEGKKLTLYGDGKNIRDWLYVLDDCSALELCLFRGKPGEIYNIGGDNEFSNLDIANLILQYFNKDESWIEFVTDRPAHDSGYATDSSKIKKELSWTPQHPFERAFGETIQWYKDNREWIDNIKKENKVFNPHIKSG